MLYRQFRHDRRYDRRRFIGVESVAALRHASSRRFALGEVFYSDTVIVIDVAVQSAGGPAGTAATSAAPVMNAGGAGSGCGYADTGLSAGGTVTG
jgi:hypothetical protein